MESCNKSPEDFNQIHIQMKSPMRPPATLPECPLVVIHGLVFYTNIVMIMM